MSFAQMIMESGMGGTKSSRRSIMKSLGSEIGDSFIKKLNENLLCLTEEAKQLKVQFQSNQSESDEKNGTSKFFMFEKEGKPKLTKTYSDDNSIKIEDAEEISKNQLDNSFGDLTSKRSNQENKENIISFSQKKFANQQKVVDFGNAHNISFESKEKQLGRLSNTGSNIFAPVYQDSNQKEHSDFSKGNKKSKNNEKNIAHKIESFDFGGSFRGDNEASFSIMEDKNSFLKKESDQLTPTRQEDQIIDIYNDDSDEKIYNENSKRLSIFNHYNEEDSNDEEEEKENIEKLKNILNHQNEGVISLSTSIRDNDKGYQLRSSDIVEIEESEDGKGTKDQDEKELRESEFDHLIQKIQRKESKNSGRENKGGMVELLEKHFEKNDTFKGLEFPEEENSSNESGILDDRRVLFESEVRKQLEENHNLDPISHLEDKLCEVEIDNENTEKSDQNKNSFQDISKISIHKSDGGNGSASDSCLDILGEKNQLSSKDLRKIISKRSFEPSRRGKISPMKKIIESSERVLNNRQADESIKTASIIQLLNGSRNKSSFKNSFITMGDDQIENLRNMFFAKENGYKSIHSESDVDIASKNFPLEHQAGNKLEKEEETLIKELSKHFTMKDKIIDNQEMDNFLSKESHKYGEGNVTSSSRFHAERKEFDEEGTNRTLSTIPDKVSLSNEEPSMVFVERNKMETMQMLIEKLEEENQKLKQKSYMKEDNFYNSGEEGEYYHNPSSGFRREQDKTSTRRKRRPSIDDEIKQLYMFQDTREYVCQQVENNLKFRKKKRAGSKTKGKRGVRKRDISYKKRNFRKTSKQFRLPSNKKKSAKCIAKNLKGLRKSSILSKKRRGGHNRERVESGIDIRDFKDIVEKVPRNSYVLIHQKRRGGR